MPGSDEADLGPCELGPLRPGDGTVAGEAAAV